MPSTAIVSPQIVDSTSIGRDLITAADQAAAQAIIGVTGVDVTADYNWTGNHDFSGTIDADYVRVDGDVEAEYVTGLNGRATDANLWFRPDFGHLFIKSGASNVARFAATGNLFYVSCSPQTSDLYDLGTSVQRWRSVGSVDGTFSGNLNTEVGGSRRLYRLGAEGDTDTEFLETLYDDTYNQYSIRTGATGSGTTIRSIYIGTGFTGTNSRGLIISNSSCTFSFGGTRLVVKGGTIDSQANFSPSANNLYDLGSDTNRWSNIYSVDGDFSGTVTTDTINASGSTLDLQLGGSTVLKANSSFSYYYGGGGNTYILQGSDFLRPQGGAAPFDLGGTSHRWRTVFAEDGSFSGNLNTEVGGTQRVYGLGTDGDADTEYIETSWDGTTAKIQTKETGSGVLRKLDVLAGSTGMKAYANSTLILSSAWSSVWANNVQVMLYAPSGGYVSVRNGDLRPYDAVTPINCGQAAVPWAGVYSVDGDFSGTLSAVTVAAQTNNLTLQSNSGNALISVANSGSISITAYGSIYQQFGTTGVGYRQNCFPIFSTLDLGSAATPWNNGYFNNLSSAVGGSYKIYNLGTEGDTDTEYLETSWDTNVAAIETKATGSGAARELRLVNGLTSIKLENAIVTLKANNANILRGSGSSATYLYAHGNGTILEVGNGEFKPFTGTVALGSAANRWSKVYGVDGDFSGDVEMAANVKCAGLPTSDPSVAGRLWNHNGTLKISAGAAPPP